MTMRSSTFLWASRRRGWSGIRNSSGEVRETSAAAAEALRGNSLYSRHGSVTLANGKVNVDGIARQRQVIARVQFEANNLVSIVEEIVRGVEVGDHGQRLDDSIETLSSVLDGEVE
jgi:hypothetical protein